MIKYICHRQRKSNFGFCALLFCSGVMELAVQDHPEQIGGIGRTKDFWAPLLAISNP